LFFVSVFLYIYHKYSPNLIIRTEGFEDHPQGHWPVYAKAEKIWSTAMILQQ
jgi:hypothetical protein